MLRNKPCLKTKLSQKRSRHTEAQIVGAATKLFAERGYSRVTMQDIADVAGIAKATLYYHTPSKEDLGLLVIDAHLDEFIRSAQDAASSARPAAERLRETIELLITWLVAGQELVEFMLPYGGKPSAKFRHRLKGFRAHYLEVLEGVVSDGMASGEFRSNVDPAVAVRAILGMIIHFHLLTIHFQEPYRIGDVRDQITEFALRGLLAGDDAS